MLMSRYLTIPGIRTIDLDATELLINDQEILEAVTDWVFADPSLMDAITLDPPAPRQDRDVGGSASSAAPEAAEGVLGESAADAESAVIAPPPPTTGETAGAPLLQPAETAVAAPTPSKVGVVEEVVGGVEPPSTQLAVATEEEAPAPRPPATVPQEHNALEGATRAACPQERDIPEGTTRAASSEIQEAGESSGPALP
jgi:hypothetical protein